MTFHELSVKVWESIAHGLVCPHQAIFECSKFASGVAALLAGSSLEEAHEEAHTHS